MNGPAFDEILRLTYKVKSNNEPKSKKTLVTLPNNLPQSCTQLTASVSSLKGDLDGTIVACNFRSVRCSRRTKNRIRHLSFYFSTTVVWF